MIPSGRDEARPVSASGARLEAVCRRLEQSRQGTGAKGAASQPKKAKTK
jgi:hypothetical protein